MPNVNVEIKFIDAALEATYGPPDGGTIGAGAVDLRACMDSPHQIAAGQSHIFHSGFSMHIKDPNVSAIIIPRSGLGIKHRLTLLNGTGLIDSDYQGEIMVGLQNDGATYTVKPYQRIAQMLFVPVYHVLWQPVVQFSESTDRGEGGFGSTGTV